MRVKCQVGGGGELTGGQTQQRALACAVGRDQPGTARAGGEGQLAEQGDLVGPGERGMGEDDRWHGESLETCGRDAQSRQRESMGPRIIGPVNRLSTAATSR